MEVSFALNFALQTSGKGDRMFKGYMNLFSIFIFFSSAVFATANPPKVEEIQQQFREIMKEGNPTFVVATAPPLFSFDPLKADFARNIDTMRLLYATPLEMDTEGHYTSTVLDKFYFDSMYNKIVFELKPNIRYDDGNLMSIDDVGMAIKRMAYTHSIFPVMKEIKGLQQWLKTKNPLTTYPDGIKVDKNKGVLEIHLNGPVSSPLFRFSLELFSIVPTSCIDPIANSLRCEIPPFSGRYKLGDHMITKINKKAHYPTFVKFEARSSNVPKHMWIAFMSPTRIVEYADDFHDTTVIKANEIDIPNFQNGTLLKKIKVYSSPKILYSVITLNPNSKTFSPKRVRQYFAMKYRDSVKAYGFEPEGSIFTNLLIGYLPLSELNKMVPSFSAKEEAEILAHLKKNPPVFLKDEGTIIHPFTYILSDTLKKMRLPEVQPIEKGEYDDLWKKGLIALRPATCGFWPIDPTGDIRMVFTPGMHKFVILDDKVSNLVANLKNNDQKSHEEFNRFLFEDSKMVITTNYSRLYFMSKKASLFIPYGISGPQPWFFFKNLK